MRSSVLADLAHKEEAKFQGVRISATVPCFASGALGFCFSVFCCFFMPPAGDATALSRTGQIVPAGANLLMVGSDSFFGYRNAGSPRGSWEFSS